MKKLQLIQLLFGISLTICGFSVRAHADPVFVQPSAGVAVVSVSGGIGRTEPFFSDLPDGSFPSNLVVNIIGNFQAFDPNGNPTSFSLIGVEVTVGSSTFNVPLVSYNFAGHPSVTFVDTLDFDTVTFFAGDPTFSFTFNAGPSLAYSYRLLTTGLPVDSLITYDDVEVPVPEPATLLLFGSSLTALLIARRKSRSVDRFK